jgi:tRNA(Ile)-lysidine synthetase-like protein
MQFITVTQMQQALRHTAALIVESEPMLTELDTRIGDGDHGIGMKAGFQALEAELAGEQKEDYYALLRGSGITLLRAMGGASGVILCTLLIGGVEEMRGVTQLDAGALTVFIEKGVEAVRREADIYFYKKQEESFEEKALPRYFDETGFDGGRYQVIVSKTPIVQAGEWRVLQVDGEKIPPTATYRFRAEGDFIRRFGGGTKTLKKFFNEEKTPVEERGYLPLIAEENGEVYVVCGVEISEAVKITQETKQPLYIGLKKL